MTCSMLSAIMARRYVPKYQRKLTYRIAANERRLTEADLKKILSRAHARRY